MAPRRRRLVLLAALALALLALGVASNPSDEGGTPGVGDPRPPASQRLPAGGERTVEVPALVDTRLGERTPRPRTIRGRVGETLTLRVAVRAPDTIEVDEHTTGTPASPDGPAEVQVLLDRVGTFPVRSIESGRVLARVRVAPAAAMPGAPEAQPRER